MELTQIVEKTELDKSKNLREQQTNNKYQVGEKREYALFSEQYLEKPVISGDYKMALSPTACSIKGIPVIDDF